MFLYLFPSFLILKHFPEVKISSETVKNGSDAVFGIFLSNIYTPFQ